MADHEAKGWDQQQMHAGLTALDEGRAFTDALRDAIYSPTPEAFDRFQASTLALGLAMKALAQSLMSEQS